jgi:hypothetical protein
LLLSTPELEGSAALAALAALVDASVIAKRCVCPVVLK